MEPGDRKTGVLAEALKRSTSLELQRRIETLLAKCTDTTVPAPEKLRGRA